MTEVAERPAAQTVGDTQSDQEILRQKLQTQFLEPESGGIIAYDDTGTPGPLVIAIPGMGDLREEYRYVRWPLARAGFRVVTMDIRGHGETSVDWPDYSARAVAQDVLALMDHLGAPAATVMGASFAAGAALWAAALAPSRVTSVVMLGPILRDPPVSRMQKIATWLVFAGPWRLAGWLAYWDTLFPSGKPADHAAYRAALKQNLNEPGRIEALKAMIELSKHDTERMVPTVRGLPCLALMGGADPDYPAIEAEAGWLGAELNAQVVVLPSVGHYPQAERPDLALAPILSFLKLG